MVVERYSFKSKTWGVVQIPGTEEFHTGYEHEWSWSLGNIWDFARAHGTPSSRMEIGTNVIFRQRPFKVDGWSRGRSAANFHGKFQGSDVQYELSMDGTGALWDFVLSGAFPIVGGYIIGDWTFAKQGQSIFLKPVFN